MVSLASHLVCACVHQVGTFAHEHEDLAHDNFIKVYSPTEGDSNQVVIGVIRKECPN